jgi:small-conductance mechanosensitive channel
MNGVNNVRSDVNRAIWRIFRANGVKIPVAQRELRMLEKAPPIRITRPGQRPGEDDEIDLRENSD